MLTKIQSDLEGISRFDPSMWETLRGKKIFATGCTGFIGSWIIYSFLYIKRKFDLDAELVCLTRNKRGNEEKFPGVRFVEGDIKTFPFPKENFDFIIHGAAEVAVYQSGLNEPSLLDAAYLGTKKIIELAKASSASKILFLSSGAAYGPQPLDLPLMDETFTGAPDVTSSKSAYGEAKRIGELLLFNEMIPSTSARIFAACGPFLPRESKYAFSNFLDSLLFDKTIAIKSNGRTTRSYLYIGDLTLWLWILLLKGRDKNIYNVGSEQELSILDLAKRMKNVLKKDIEIEVQGKEDGYNRYIPSTKKMRDEFNIRDLTALDMSIKKSYDFLKEV